MASKLSRRKVLSSFGLTGLGMLASQASVGANHENLVLKKPVLMEVFPRLTALMESESLKPGNYVQTAGYYQSGDGGHGTYVIKVAEVGMIPDQGSIISLKGDLIAELINVTALNYKLFGAIGDQKNDDGVQIKAAHNYANAKRIPVINPNGEYWFRETNAIEIRTNTDWGQSIFHFDEKYNSREPRFKIVNDQPAKSIELSKESKDSLIKQLKPGVQVIPELAPYKNCMIVIVDADDLIGLRNQSTGISKGWSREEIFYVEEHGRILGDIAWSFKGYTSLMAYPASDSYLNITGGTFYLSGDNEGAYFENGIRVERSRTLLSNQWVGLEPGKQDIAKIQRSGFYSLRYVYDVTLETIRLLPWEKDRVGVPMVPQGTYGISGNRWMNVTFRNITAEGSPVHWGVFGTNLTKNFRIESCVLNRVDVHFHCWNLYIKDSKVGQRGLTMTGGGDLFIENTNVNNNTFVSFRSDYGAKWDGDIRIRNCRLIPRTNASQVAVLQFTTADFDFKYPIGYGRTLLVQDMVIDFTGDPTNKAVCWLMRTSEWKENADKVALFFPDKLEFSNISVRGRKQGVRLMQIFDCSKFHMAKEGSYDGVRLQSNSRMLFQNIDLENFSEDAVSKSIEKVHFYLNDSPAAKLKDALYPDIRIRDCNNLRVYMGKGSGNLRFDNCSVQTIEKDAAEFKGRLSFNGCEFDPSINEGVNVCYDLDSELGISFSDCIVYMPRAKDKAASDSLNKIGFLKLNKQVRFNHSNTRLGNDIIQYCKAQGIKLEPRFIAMLKSHHELEAES